MRRTTKDWVSIAVILVVTNFLWNAVTDRDWMAAFDHSYFQVTAILIAWFSIGRRMNKESDR